MLSEDERMKGRKEEEERSEISRAGSVNVAVDGARADDRFVCPRCNEDKEFAWVLG